MVISTEVRCGQTISEHEVSTSDDHSIRIERDDVSHRAPLLVVARVQEKAKGARVVEEAADFGVAMFGPSELSESADSSIGVGDKSLLAEGILSFGQGVGGHALRHLEEDAAGGAKRRSGESGGCRYANCEARQQGGVSVNELGFRWVGARSGVSVKRRFGCCEWY